MFRAKPSMHAIVVQLLVDFLLACISRESGSELAMRQKCFERDGKSSCLISVGEVFPEHETHTLNLTLNEMQTAACE
jgi:hypothetical protein